MALNLYLIKSAMFRIKWAKSSLVSFSQSIAYLPIIFKKRLRLKVLIQAQFSKYFIIIHQAHYNRIVIINNQCEIMKKTAFDTAIAW